MISQFNLVVIIASSTILSFAMIDSYYDSIVLIYAQTIDSDYTNTTILKLENIPTKHVKVEDIYMSYKILVKEIQFY
jgi:hypothetical protein